MSNPKNIVIFPIVANDPCGSPVVGWGARVDGQYIQAGCRSTLTDKLELMYPNCKIVQVPRDPESEE